MDIKITEKINDSYSWGTYGDYKVIVMNDNQYINCGKLCNDFNKDFFDWKRINNKLIKKFEDDNNINAVIIIKGGKDHKLWGTYVNKLIVPNIINWLQQDKNYLKEKIIVQKLNETLKGDLEVQTDVGRIDILTDTEIIEVKEYTNYKSALGQILMYGHYYPDKKMRVHLFDVKNNNIKIIEEIYKKYNVALSWE